MNNTLIKKKTLARLLKERGIRRVNPRAMQELNVLITKQIEKIAGKLKENIIIKGRKTLKTEDISDLQAKEGEYFEI